MNNIPNLFIIGAPKTGTTALANNLAQHHDIFISEQKEPRYFDAHTFYDYEEDYPIKNLENYLNLFDSKDANKSLYKLDASVFNMYSEKSINDILKLSPNAKFIILLREPVEATLSMHKQRLGYVDIKMREISDDFMQCWNKLEDRKEDKGFPKGCRNKFLFRYDLLYSYERYLPFIIDSIKNENLFIGFYDDYKNKPEEFYSKLFVFLGIKNYSIKNKTLNQPVTIKKSFLLEIIEVFAQKSLVIREKIGLKGGKLSAVKNFIFSFYATKSLPPQRVEKEVYDYFNNTNQYMEQLSKSIKDTIK